MKTNDWLASRDADFDIQQANLVILLLANAVIWGIPALVVAAVQAVQATWVTTYGVAKVKNNRTPNNTSAKNIAKKAFRKTLRSTAKQYLMFNPLVTDLQREAMGITVPKTTRSHTPLPETSPLISVKVVDFFKLKFTFRVPNFDPGDASRAKPAGVDRVALRGKIGGTAPVVLEDYNLYQDSGRITIILTFAQADRGKQFYFTGAWKSKSGVIQFSNWSPGASVTIP